MTDHPAVSGPRQAARELLAEVEELEGPRAGPVIGELRALLEAPVRIAVAGRVSSGKSTLVNALIGTHVAATAARELTSVLTVFRYGAPRRAEVHLKDGSSLIRPFPPKEGPDLDSLEPADIAWVAADLPQGVLRERHLIDTPGLGSAMTTHAEATELGLLSEAVSGARPDVVLYVVRDAFRSDDQDFLRRYHQAWTSPGRSGADRGAVILVISHADNFGAGPWGPEDPIDRAVAAAGEVAAAHPELAGAVAVSGLLAETVRTGALQEADVRTLRHLSRVPEDDLRFAGQLGPPPGIDADQLIRLEGLLGGYGLRHGRSRATSSPELSRWLEERSGLRHLEGLLGDQLGLQAECSRVDLLLRRLARTARQEGWGELTEAVIERARGTRFLLVDLWDAAVDLRLHAPEHPMLQRLEDLMVRSDQEPDGRRDRDSLLTLASQFQAEEYARTGAERAAARVLARAYLAKALGGPG